MTKYVALYRCCGSPNNTVLRCVVAKRKMCPVSSSDSQHITVHIIRGRQIKEGRISSFFVAACVSRSWSFSKWMTQNDRSSPLLEGGGAVGSQGGSGKLYMDVRYTSQ